MEYKEDFDGIDIKYLFLSLWARKNIIFFITLFGAVFSVFFALSQNNIFRSMSVLKPVIHQNLQERPNLSNIVNSPLNLLSNNNATGQNLFFSVEKMQNLDFFNNLYEKENFLVELYASKEYVYNTGELIIDSDIYDVNSNKWTRDKENRPPKPSLQEAKKEFYDNNFNLDINEENGFIYLSIDHISPKVAQDWNVFIVSQINTETKEYEFNKATNELNYLKQNLFLPEFASVKESISYLITQKINALAMIESSPNYAFEYVQKAFIPERKHGPSRALICISITFFFGLISLFIAAILNIFSINLKKIFSKE